MKKNERTRITKTEIKRMRKRLTEKGKKSKKGTLTLIKANLKKVKAKRIF